MSRSEMSLVSVESQREMSDDVSRLCAAYTLNSREFLRVSGRLVAARSLTFSHRTVRTARPRPAIFVSCPISNHFKFLVSVFRVGSGRLAGARSRASVQLTFSQSTQYLC